MVSRRERGLISVLLVLLFALAGCGPPVPGYTISTFPTPTATVSPPTGSTTASPTTTSASPTTTSASPTTTSASPTTTSASPPKTPIPCTAETIAETITPSAVAPETVLTPSPPPPPSPSPDGSQALPDLTVAAPECSVALEAADGVPDCLVISVDLRNEGADAPEAASVPLSLSSDTGLSATDNLAATREATLQAVKVDVKTTDFERVHTFTITADPEGIIQEVNENNNSVEVEIALPARDAVIPGATCPAEPSGPPLGSASESPVAVG